MITSFDKSNLRNLRHAIDDALAEIGTKYGIVFKAGNASFDSNNATFKLNLSVRGEDGTVKSKTRVALETFYPMYVDKIITLRGRGGSEQGKVVGYNNKAHKFPFLVETASGTFKVGEDRLR